MPNRGPAARPDNRKPARMASALVALLALCHELSAAPLVNVAGPRYGTQVRADTQFSEKHAGSNAVDGRLVEGDGCWYSKDQTKLPCALTLQLAGEEDVRKVVLVQARWQGNMYHTKDFALEASGDGQKWERLATGQLPDENLARAELEVHARTRWLRIVVLTSYNSFQTCGLTEVELWAAGHPGFGPPEILFKGEPAPPPTADVCGLSFIAAATGSQLALFGPDSSLLVSLGANEEVALTVPITALPVGATVRAAASLIEGAGAEVEVSFTGGLSHKRALSARARSVALEVGAAEGAGDSRVCLRVWAASEAAVRLSSLRLTAGTRSFPLPITVVAPDYGAGPPPVSPELRPALQRALIEWDWKLQDGIGTPRNPSTYPAAVAQTLERGQRLVDDLCDQGLRERLGPRLARWQALKRESDDLVADTAADEARWADLYLRVHWLRREIALQNPLADVGPLLFVKRVPACFSHQLTQYYGRYARPGGGVFVLDQPGVSMACRQLAPGMLPTGSPMHPEVSYDGKRILFAYCAADTTPTDTRNGHQGRYYHVYGMDADGADLKQLTDGPYNDFAPRFLPNGETLFVSTRRGGWHRCGSPGCETYTLATMNADGTDAHPVSYHETQEWDPAVLANGRVIYTRWDYVDRHPVFYEHLWTSAPDGTSPMAFFGNNTFNPVGIWEPQQVPGSPRIMATAAAHHAMTAGSIILVDPRKGVDGLDSITRLTPDAPFPESETPVPPSWFNPQPGVKPFETPESQRWPGHCYRSSWALSETYFLAAYSFQGLIGEPTGNAANMFGLYLIDTFGDKELLYRDPNIASAWPIPLRPRLRPPVVPSQLDPELGDDGLLVLQNVYDANPALPAGSVKALRIVQVLPKSTPGIDNPAVGRPRGAPGKQVLGTVPVEPDGSAYFRVPARIEIAFQALDQRGMAVQVMRSETYLHPGERVTCVGCHESRLGSPPETTPQALSRAPSQITPGPDGSKPLSYPLLVQPVLDKHCVSCHSGDKPKGDVTLTAEPEGHYTKSYNALVERVPFSDQGNAEAISQPGRFGALGSPVMQKLLAGHHEVKLTAEDTERLATWMDANALFYGTFDPADQARQLLAEHIEGPKLE